jgi:hypothetical protein
MQLDMMMQLTALSSATDGPGWRVQAYLYCQDGCNRTEDIADGAIRGGYEMIDLHVHVEEDP